MLKQGEIYKLKDNRYGICGGIITNRDLGFSGLKSFTEENIDTLDFDYVMFLVDTPSMKGINATDYRICSNLEIIDFRDTHKNAGKDFTLFMLKWKMLSGIKVSSVDEYIKDIKTQGEKSFSKIIHAKAGDRFRFFFNEFTYLGIVNKTGTSCYVALLNKNNAVQNIVDVDFLLGFEKVGHVDITVDTKYLSYEEYKRVTKLHWLI